MIRPDFILKWIVVSWKLVILNSFPGSDSTHQTSPTTTNRSKSLPTDPIQLLRWLDAHWNTHQTPEITFPNELWKERIVSKSCPFAQNRYWLRHFHKCRGHAELDFCGSTSISNAVRNSGGLETSVAVYLPSNSLGDLYIYSNVFFNDSENLQKPWFFFTEKFWDRKHDPRCSRMAPRSL